MWFPWLIKISLLITILTSAYYSIVIRMSNIALIFTILTSCGTMMHYMPDLILLGFLDIQLNLEVCRMLLWVVLSANIVA